MGETLIKAVDVFKCCILTWDFFPVVLPAFLIAGAIPVFVPAVHILRYLGYGARKVVAYTAASFSGFIIAMCSCNIVPLAASIYRRGAGIGPAFAFLYAGPAINFITMVWVFQVVGWRMGLWRAAAVPIIAVLIGLLMQLIFRREDTTRRVHFQAVVQREIYTGEAVHPQKLGLLFGLLIGILIFGAKGLPWWLRFTTLVVFGGGLVLVVRRWFTREELRDWLEETLHFLKLVLPILVSAILAIGLAFRYIPIKWMHDHIYPLVGDNSPRATFIAAAFGSVMYFPILTEVAFTKALLKYEMLGVGPALAILLNGPGVSLPGALLLLRIFGWKKTLVYEGLEMFLGGLTAMWFGRLYGEYVCPCQTGEGANPVETLIAVIVMMVVIVLAAFIVFRFSLPPAEKEPPLAPEEAKA